MLSKIYEFITFLFMHFVLYYFNSLQYINFKYNTNVILLFLKLSNKHSAFRLKKFASRNRVVRT